MNTAVNTAIAGSVITTPDAANTAASGGATALFLILVVGAIGYLVWATSNFGK